MAGLFFLWQNVPSTPPTIVNIDYGISPVLISVLEEKSLLEAVLSPDISMSINTIAPEMLLQATTSVFTDTTTSWSDPTVSWSDSNNVWGGLDPKGADKPIMGIIDNIRPEFWKVGNK